MVVLISMAPLSPHFWTCGEYLNWVMWTCALPLSSIEAHQLWVWRAGSGPFTGLVQSPFGGGGGSRLKNRRGSFVAATQILKGKNFFLS